MIPICLGRRLIEVIGIDKFLVRGVDKALSWLPITCSIKNACRSYGGTSAFYIQVAAASWRRCLPAHRKAATMRTVSSAHPEQVCMRSRASGWCPPFPGSCDQCGRTR